MHRHVSVRSHPSPPRMGTRARGQHVCAQAARRGSSTLRPAHIPLHPRTSPYRRRGSSRLACTSLAASWSAGPRCARRSPRATAHSTRSIGCASRRRRRSADESISFPAGARAPARLPACLPACLPVCLSACLPACLPARYAQRTCHGMSQPACAHARARVCVHVRAHGCCRADPCGPRVWQCRRVCELHTCAAAAEQLPPARARCCQFPLVFASSMLVFMSS